jgi:hypothetical protein
MKTSKKEVSYKRGSYKKNTTKKTVRFGLVISEQENNDLDELAVKLATTKSAILRSAFIMYYNEKITKENQ